MGKKICFQCGGPEHGSFDAPKNCPRHVDHPENPTNLVAPKPGPANEKIVMEPKVPETDSPELVVDPQFIIADGDVSIPTAPDFVVLTAEQFITLDLCPTCGTNLAAKRKDRERRRRYMRRVRGLE